MLLATQQEYPFTFYQVIVFASALLCTPLLPQYTRNVLDERLKRSDPSCSPRGGASLFAGQKRSTARHQISERRCVCVRGRRARDSLGPRVFTTLTRTGMDGSGSALDHLHSANNSAILVGLGQSTTSGLLQGGGKSRRDSRVSAAAASSVTAAASSPVTFEERRAFPHLYAFRRGAEAAGGANNNGPGGAPVVRTDAGSLVFPARRSSGRTWLRRYRHRATPDNLPVLSRRTGSSSTPALLSSSSSSTSAATATGTATGYRRRRRRRRRDEGQKPFQHEIDPVLLSSALPLLTTFSEFRHNVLFKPQRRALLRSQQDVQAAERRRYVPVSFQCPAGSVFGHFIFGIRLTGSVLFPFLNMPHPPTHPHTHSPTLPQNLRARGCQARRRAGRKRPDRL